MVFLFRKSRSITDDRGTSHIMSWSMNLSEEAHQYLGRRVGAEFRETMGWGFNRRVAGSTVLFVLCYFLVIMGTMALLAQASVSHILTSFVSGGVIMCMMFAFFWYKHRSYRAMYQRVALISVEEGACGSCWYDLRSLPPGDDAMLICPECQAAWLASRVRPSAGEGGTSADPMPKRAGTQQKEVDTLARALMLDLPTPVKDDRGRTYSLVRSRDLRLRAGGSHGALRERYLAGARALRSVGKFRRVGGSSLLIVFGVILLVSKAFTMPLSRSVWDWVSWLWIVFFGGVFTLRAVGLFFRSDGVSPAAGRALLLIRSLCPSCGSSLTGIEADAEGHTVCSQCSAAWKLPTPPKSVRYSACPKCQVDVRNVYADEQGRLVCGACEHVMSDVESLSG